MIINVLHHNKSITYRIDVTSNKLEEGYNGAIRINKDNSTEEQVVIDVLISDESKVDKRVALADELEHGRQFLDGELGFSQDNDGKNIHIGYDIGDEVKSQQASVDASRALEIPLNGVQTDFINKNTDEFTKAWYPAIQTRKEPRFATGSIKDGQSREDVKSFYIIKGDRNLIAYRQNGLNVIIKK